jgi:flagellin
MALTIHTNVGQMVAIQNLRRASDSLEQTNKRVSSGLNVSDAYDDGAAFAVAVNIRSDVSVLGTVNERLAVGKGMIDVAIKAGEYISLSLRDVLTRLSDQALTAADRSNFMNQYNSLISDVDAYITDAKYNEITLIDRPRNQSIISSLEGTNITIVGHNLTNSVSHALFSADISSATAAVALLGPNGAIANMESSLGQALNNLASDARRIANQISFNTSLMDANQGGLGYILDSDMAKESVRLQSLQVKQQLSSQSLSIANQFPRALLGLFD